MAYYYDARETYSITIPEYDVEEGTETWLGTTDDAFVRNDKIYWFVQDNQVTDDTPYLLVLDKGSTIWRRVWEDTSYSLSSYCYNPTNDRFTICCTYWASPNLTQYFYEFDFVEETFSFITSRVDVIINSFGTFGAPQHANSGIDKLYTGHLGYCNYYNGSSWEADVLIDPLGLVDVNLEVVKNIFVDSNGDVIILHHHYATAAYDSDTTWYFVHLEADLSAITYTFIVYEHFSTDVEFEVDEVWQPTITEFGNKIFIAMSESMLTPTGSGNFQNVVYEFSSYTVEPATKVRHVVFGYDTPQNAYYHYSVPTFLLNDSNQLEVGWGGSPYSSGHPEWYGEWPIFWSRTYNGATFETAIELLDVNLDPPWALRSQYSSTKVFLIKALWSEGTYAFTYGQWDKPGLEDNYSSAIFLRLEPSSAEIVIDFADYFTLVDTIDFPSESIGETCHEVKVGSAYCTYWKDKDNGDEQDVNSPYCQEWKTITNTFCTS